MIILLYGDDEFRRNEKLQEMKESFARKYPASRANIETIDFTQTTWDDAKGKFRTGALFAEKRFISIRGFFGKSAPSISYEEFERCFRSEGNEDTNFIFEHGALSEKNIKWFNTMGAIMVRVKKLDGPALRKWVHARVGSWGGSIDERAVDALIVQHSADLWTLNNELSKLFHYGNKIITMRVVQEWHTVSFENRVFRWLDAVRAGVMPAAITGTSDVYEEETPPYVSVMIASEFRDLMLMYAGTADNSLIHPFRQKKIAQSVRAFSLGRIRATYDRALALDRAAKRVSPSTHEALTYDFLFTLHETRP